jgi:hypothetical protein
MPRPNKQRVIARDEALACDSIVSQGSAVKEFSALVRKPVGEGGIAHI